MEGDSRQTEPAASEVVRARRLDDATSALAQAVTPAAVAQATLAHAMPALAADAGALAVLSPDGAELEVLASSGFPDELYAAWRPFPGDQPHPLAEAIRHDASVWVPSSEAYRARFPAPPPAGQAFNAWAALPLRIDGGGLGVLALGFHAPRGFGEDDQAFLQAVAEQSAQALARTRLHEATTRAAERLARLQALAGTLAQAASTVQVAEAIVAQVGPGLGAAACAVLVLSPDGSWLELLAGNGLSPAVTELFQRLPMSSAHPAADVLRSNAPMWLPSNAALL
jgi:transcriptional regulator with GAF, ATPase, and Fis domain